MANNMLRWDPFREMVTLRDAMDSLFENALIRPFDGEQGGYQGATGGYLPVDVMENDDNFVVRASLPGMNPEDLNVTVTHNVLTIQGEIKSDEQQGNRYHLRERRWGKFSRQIELPAPVDANNVHADYTSGTLTLTLPKSEAVKPKRITIQANGQKMIEGQSRQS
jgi:HSP20 family protein